MYFILLGIFSPEWNVSSHWFLQKIVLLIGTAKEVPLRKIFFLAELECSDIYIMYVFEALLNVFSVQSNIFLFLNMHSFGWFDFSVAGCPSLSEHLRRRLPAS